MFITSVPVPVRPIPPEQLCSFMMQHLDETVVVFEDGGEVKALHHGQVHPALSLLDTYPIARFVAFLVDMPAQFYVYAALHVRQLHKLIVVT